MKEIKKFCFALSHSWPFMTSAAEVGKAAKRCLEITNLDKSLTSPLRETGLLQMIYSCLSCSSSFTPAEMVLFYLVTLTKTFKET